MRDCTIRNCEAGDLPAIVGLQERYARRYPGATLIPAEVYRAPAFEGGRNIACALAADGSLAGYAPLYPAPAAGDPRLPRVIWAEIKVDPALTEPDRVRDQLFDRTRLRVAEIADEMPGRPCALAFQYLPSETEAIAYVAARGALFTDSIFRMRRDLGKPIPRATPPAGIRIVTWRMPEKIDPVRYVEARNEAFPDEPVALTEWQYFLSSPQWATGTLIAAFSGAELAGCVTVYWAEISSDRDGRAAGYTENIFVRPAWRGRGIARSMLRAALLYLRKHGLVDALLEVRAHNRQAVRLYYSLGYDTAQETHLYVLAWPNVPKYD